MKKSNYEIDSIIQQHLRDCEFNITRKLQSTQLISEGLGMLYTIYQAYKQLSTMDLPADKKLISIESDFNQYLKTVNKKFIQ